MGGVEGQGGAVLGVAEPVGHGAQVDTAGQQFGNRSGASLCSSLPPISATAPRPATTQEIMEASKPGLKPPHKRENRD
jgi:hypothetical protein